MASLGLNIEEQKAVDRFRQQVAEPSMTSLVILDFWAEWCGPCKQIGPILDEIATEMAGKLTVAKVNIDNNPEAPQRFGVRGIPTMILFKAGAPAATKVGAAPKGQIKGWLEAELA